MNNSADIRRENKRSIYRFLMREKACTKQQTALGTGLSAATCNTLLNDLASQGIVTGKTKLSGEIGRSSTLYQIQDEHESYLALHFYLKHGEKTVETLVFSPSGTILSKETQTLTQIRYSDLEERVQRIQEKFPNLAQIIVGTPSIAEHGIIRYCDIPELENLRLKEKLEQRFGLPTVMENDMYHKAYGYYKTKGNPDEVITLGYFQSHILPGTATIHKGTIIRGANSFAGMTGFLPYDISREEQLSLLHPGACIPFISKSIAAILVLLNPDAIVLTGDLITEDLLSQVKDNCKETIPMEYMPRFIITDSFDDYYYQGMFQLAVDQKKF